MNSESSTLKQQTARGLLWGMLNNGTMQLLNLLFGIFHLKMLYLAMKDITKK